MEQCEIVWVRCKEPRERLLAAIPRGARVSIVEKCGEHGQGTALEVANVGEEGFGYASWITERYNSLPTCVFLVHGGWMRRPVTWDQVATLFGCVRQPVRAWTRLQPLPLAHMWRIDRMLNGDGLSVFYRHLREKGVNESSMPDLRSKPLSYYATNMWLVPSAALRSRPRAFWQAMRDASLLRGQWRGFAEMGVGRLHSEMGLIYEHVFHVALGLPAAPSEAAAWRQRAAQAIVAFDETRRTNQGGCRGPVRLFGCNSTTRCTPDCRAQWPRLCGLARSSLTAPGRSRPQAADTANDGGHPRRKARRAARKNRGGIGFRRSWTPRSRPRLARRGYSGNHSDMAFLRPTPPPECVNVRPTPDGGSAGVPRSCFLVVLAHAGEDVRWLARSSLPYVLIPKNASIPNVGLDASTYLWFIVQHYDALPWFHVLHPRS